MQGQDGFVPNTYGATPFDQFLDWEEIPVIRNFVVDDIRKTEKGSILERVEPRQVIDLTFQVVIKPSLRA